MKSPREIKRAAMARAEQYEVFRCSVCGRGGGEWALLHCSRPSRCRTCAK